MKWTDYRKKYRNFLIAMYQAQLTTLAAGAALDEFPKNLPPRLKEGLFEELREVAKALEAVAKSIEEPMLGGVNGERPESKIRKSSPAFWPMFSLMSTSVLEGRGYQTPDFTQVIYKQQLVMIVAHLEAFLGDSIRAICYRHPDIVTRSQKQISWADALSHRSRTKLLSSLVELYVAGLRASKSVCSIVEGLNKELRLEARIDHPGFADFTMAEQVRHLVVHSGGYVDSKFKKKTASKLAVGAEYTVTSAFLETATVAALVVAQILFDAVSKKFFGHPDAAREGGPYIDLDSGGRPKHGKKHVRVKRAQQGIQPDEPASGGSAG